MNCPACGASVRETDKFCSECGSALQAKRSDAPCRACGQMVPVGSKFCGNCGASEPHSVPAGATGETVVARAPVRPPADASDDAAAKPSVESPTAEGPSGKSPSGESPSEREREPTEPPPSGLLPPESEDEDTGVFRRMIEEELEATADLGLEEVRRGTGTPSKVQPDPTQEHHLIKPLGFALAGRASVKAKKAKAVAEASDDEVDTETKTLAPSPAGPKRPLGLAKRPQPQAPAEPPATIVDEAEEEASTVSVKRMESPVEPPAEDEIDVDVAVDDDVAGIWPDITEEVAEVRFYLLQGLEDDARAALAGLKEKHGHHPDLATLEAELSGTPAPSSKKKPKQAPKPERVAVQLGSATKPATQPEPVASTRGAADSSVTVARVVPKQITVPAAAIEIDVSLGAPERTTTARPAPPSRTGVTAPMDKPPLGRAGAKRTTQPPQPPPPPSTTPRSTPSVPPLPKPAKPELSTTTRTRGAVPPPPMPVIPDDPITSEDAMERSGEIEAPRSETVVAAYVPAPPPSPDPDPDPVPEPAEVAPPPMPGEAARQPEPPVDRTVVSPAPSAPSPRTTLVPGSVDRDRPPPPAPFGGELPPGATLVPGTTPPPGGFADVEAVSSPVARHVERTGTPPMPMAEPSAEAAARIEADAAEPIASEPEPEPSPRNETVIAPAPLPPAPYEGDAPVTLAPAQTIRLVMLGSRGQTVAERTIRPGDSLDVGRDPAQPWGDDEYLAERHARITPAAGGGVLVDDYDGSGPVFRQLAGRTRIRPGDELRVGQSIIRFEPGEGHGQLVAHPKGAEATQVHVLGNAGATVGRETGDITFVDDTYVSGAHCRFLCEGDEVYVEDLDSSNGTYVRVRQGEPVELGTLLLLGHTQFRVRPA